MFLWAVALREYGCSYVTSSRKLINICMTCNVCLLFWSVLFLLQVIAYFIGKETG